MLRSVLAASVAVLAVVAGPMVGSPAVASVGIDGDDAGDRYIGRGGLILPATVDSGQRVAIATCVDCEWRLATPCAEPVAGQAFSGTSTCGSVVGRCGDERELLRVWFRRGDAPWRDVGLICLGPGGPVTVIRLGDQVRDRLERGVPAQRPSCQPARGAVAQLPVLFTSGQDRDWRASATLLGLPVDITAQARWSWDFGDGVVQDTAIPGARYPATEPGHAYRRAATYRVEMATTWSAQFTAAGLGPFPIHEPVIQRTTMAVRVGEGRALLAQP